MEAHNRKFVNTPDIIAMAFIMLVSIFAANFLYNANYSRALKAINLAAENKARLHLNVIQSEMDKQRAIPIILSDDLEVKNVLKSKNPKINNLSYKLETLRERTGSAVIYILDNNGFTISSSNWRYKDSFVGKNYGFRDYFKNAIKNGKAEQFALGTISKKPGLYLSSAIKDNDKIIGVAVVKVEFDAIEKAWQQAHDYDAVTDANNIILITGNNQMRFKDYSKLPIAASSIKIPVNILDWSLRTHYETKPAQISALKSTLIFIFIDIFIIATIIFFKYINFKSQEALFNARIRKAELEEKVQERTKELDASNYQLSQKIIETEKYQNKLNKLQEDLIHANKLAILGQITAGVAHEINQPLATIQILSENGKKILDKNIEDGQKLITNNFDNIIKMCARINNITSELKIFSRRDVNKVEPTYIFEVLESLKLVMGAMIKEKSISLNIEKIPNDTKVMAQKIRLEQIIINLMQNAIDACDTKNCIINIKFENQNDNLIIYIEDNGGGLSDEAKANLFLPFHTTKAKGLGLGLVIASEIAQDFGGKLYFVDNKPFTTFGLLLKKAI